MRHLRVAIAHAGEGAASVLDLTLFEPILSDSPAVLREKAWLLSAIAIRDKQRASRCVDILAETMTWAGLIIFFVLFEQKCLLYVFILLRN